MSNIHDVELERLFKEADRAHSCFVTVSILDPRKRRGNLTHYTLNKGGFPNTEIIPSLDACIRSRGLRKHVEVTANESPPVKAEQQLNIAVITHFNKPPDSYSPGVAAKNFLRTLNKHGHRTAFFVLEGSPIEDTITAIGSRFMPVIPKFNRSKDVVDVNAKTRTIDVLREHMPQYDLAITFDMYLRDTVTYREAIKECNTPIAWGHWARSGLSGEMQFDMPNALYLYLNRSDIPEFARCAGIETSKVRVVYNEKDPCEFFNTHLITGVVINEMKLWEKDIICVYPVCSTRFDAKGVYDVIATIAALKRAGKNVALIICNSNSRQRIEEINEKLRFASGLNLIDHCDILFMSTLSENGTDMDILRSEIPRQVVADLFRLSNLFIFATIAEAGPNILLEAGLSKTLMVLNEDVPCLFDFVDKDMVISYLFSHRTETGLDELARIIITELEASKFDNQFRKIWRNHDPEVVYRQQISPVIHELAKMTSNIRNGDAPRHGFDVDLSQLCTSYIIC